MEILQPTLLLDMSICESNISQMVFKIENSNVVFRPHFKTHQSAEIGKLFRKFGVNKICVSSVMMAEYFADNGWNDITIAFPVNLREIQKIEKLSNKIKLNLLLENRESLVSLNSNLKSSVDVIIKIDTGYHRTGILSDNLNEIGCLIDEIGKSKFMRFTGFLSHFGNTYSTSNPSEIELIFNQSVVLLNDLKSKFSQNYPDLIISVGDTPSASIIEKFDNIDELRPGNFVFYDVMQYYLGSCKLGDIAVCLACPVVAKHNPVRTGEIVIYGGGIHLSKEYVLNSDGVKIYGLVALFNGKKWEIQAESNYVSSLSQEHGIVHLDSELINKVSVGGLIGILPIHSCMTANLAGQYLTTDNRVIQMM